MKIDKGRISGTQFMFSVACFIQASSLLTSFLSPITLQDSWFVILIGIILCLPLMWLFRELMVMFPDKNLIQILEYTFGPVIGKIVGIGYLWFFITLFSLNLSDMGEFTILTIMDETPIYVLTILCLIVCAVAVSGGIKLVTRYSMMFYITAFLILILSLFLMSSQMKPQNFLPFLNLPANKYIQGTHIITTIPFGEIVIFLMIFPAAKLERRQVTKFLFPGFLLGTFTVAAVMAGDIAVLGNTLGLFTLPHLVSLRLVNLGPAVSRVEILFAIVLIMLLFFKITVLFYVTVLTVAQLFRAKTFRHLVLIIGALTVAYGLTLYPNPAEHSASAQEIVPAVWTLFEIIIPLVLFIVAKLRHPKTKKAES